MQVKEMSHKGLSHEFSITVPFAEVDKLVTEKLVEVGSKANIQGFRPGKAPQSVIKQRYGASVRAEVLEDMITDNTQKALTERKLKPAMQPHVELVNADEGKDLEFTVKLDVLPEIKLADFSKLSFEKPVVDVPEEKVFDTIRQAAKQMREPEVVSEKRGAKKGDVVVIDFDGTVDGERQPGMKAEKHQLELGTKSFIDTFEDQLVGLKVGDSKDVKVTFPKDYHAENLAGKAAVFAVKLHEIRQHKPLVFDDALAVELGFKTIDDLKKRIADDIGAEYAKAGRMVIKRKLLDKLSDTHKFEVPNSLLDAEFDGIWKQVLEGKARGEMPEEDKGKSDDELRKEYRNIADRRIRLGLVLAEVGVEQKITATPEEMRNAMIAEARRFPGQEQMVINYFTKTEGALERLRAPIIEEKTVDYILSKAKVTEKKVSVEELMKLGDEE